MSKALSNKIKLVDVVDAVADFGAYNDGTNPSITTAAIQAAVNTGKSGLSATDPTLALSGLGTSGEIDGFIIYDIN